jgi:hypothetical protein
MARLPGEAGNMHNKTDSARVCSKRFIQNEHTGDYDKYKLPASGETIEGDDDGAIPDAS